MSKPILTTIDLRKSFGEVEAVRGISFHVLEGEIFSLLGPNGAGKTSTISMLSGLLTPTGGTATIDGLDTGRDLLLAKKIIGVVPQEIALYDELSGRRNLTFWGQMYDMGGKTLKKRIDEVLEIVGLTERAGDRVETYSGGMKRRLNIAAGLLHRPKLLFMDEPTVGIDPQSRRRILDTVKSLRDQGMTVLYTTHYMEEAEELSDRVGIIDRGRLIAVGNQKELTRMVGEQENLKLYPADGHDSAELAQLLQDVPGVLAAGRLNGQVILTVDEAEVALPGVIAAANQADVRIRSIDIEEPNLEAVFLHLTGRALRD
jgi:ABC-2 type transport system ATP-binding protein